MRWMVLAMVLLITLVIAVHVAGLTVAAALLTPLAGIVVAVLAAWVLRAPRH